MGQVQIGTIDFKNGWGSILERGTYYDFISDPHGIVPPLFGAAADDLVIVEGVDDPASADAARAHLRDGVRLGCLLSAWSFDPPEDHPDGLDLTYLDALVNDFRGINDDLDTLEGVRGEHFTRLLTWQPRIDPSRTALFALIMPGPLDEVGWRDRGAAAWLGATFDANGYDAVIFAGRKYDAAEMAILGDFAAEMAAAVALPLILATPARVGSIPPPFAMNFTLGRLY
jgi:hypothetical protein